MSIAAKSAAKTIALGAAAASAISGRSNSNVIEGHAIELPAGTQPQPGDNLPVARPADKLERRKEGTAVIKTAAAATAGGLVAGAASIALAKVAREIVKPIPGLSRRRKRDIESSQSILIDVHYLKSRK
ncbi:MAG: hypothetical protein JHC87_07550 [Thermoleophilaceae bacterium]|nr:hypothetical protein [Thermoleophilaceae bacterium]